MTFLSVTEMYVKQRIEPGLVASHYVCDWQSTRNSNEPLQKRLLLNPVVKNKV